MKLKLVTVAITILFAQSALSQKNKQKPVPVEIKTAVDLKSMDKTIEPGVDFFRYANGNWLKENPVPASESRWGNFNLVNERNNTVLRKILEENAKLKDLPASSIESKLSIFYKLYIDTLKREKDGFTPASQLLEEVKKTESKKDLLPLIASLHRKGIRTLFNFGVAQDLKNSRVYIPYFSQGGLGLPDRDFYFKMDNKSIQIKKEYSRYISNLFELFGFNTKDSEINSSIVLQIENDLAQSSMNRVERRDPDKQYNKFRFDDFAENKMKNFNLNDYIAATNILRFDSVIVSQPEFYNQLNSIIDKYSIEDLKTYINWTVMNATAAFLSPSIEQAHFHFYSTILNGVKEQKPLWKRAIAACNNDLGEILGQQFVNKAFSHNAKIKVNEMVEIISQSFASRVNQLDWMSPETKQNAMGKLNTITRKFGFPDLWKNFVKLEIKSDSYLQNHLRSNEFDYNEMIEKMGKSVDKNEWHMLPQTVNAYYNPVNNEIVFPAAILQAPFFDENADAAANYGAIGAVIGHEITHGFDDQGSKYDANGNLNSWWNAQDRNMFTMHTKKLGAQYGRYKVGDSLYINGQLTMGENIADLGGLNIAYDAFQIYLIQNPSDNIVKDGFTPNQRFFIAFAQIWKNNIRTEAMRQLVLTDTHSPGEYRVNGVLPNMPAFYDAFNVKENQAMFKNENERVYIW